MTLNELTELLNRSALPAGTRVGVRVVNPEDKSRSQLFGLLSVVVVRSLGAAPEFLVELVAAGLGDDG